jgi:hypothetical protein
MLIFLVCSMLCDCVQRAMFGSMPVASRPRSARTYPTQKRNCGTLAQSPNPWLDVLSHLVRVHSETTQHSHLRTRSGRCGTSFRAHDRLQPMNQCHVLAVLVPRAARSTQSVHRVVSWLIAERGRFNAGFRNPSGQETNLHLSCHGTFRIGPASTWPWHVCSQSMLPVTTQSEGVWRSMGQCFYAPNLSQPKEWH